MKKSIILCLAFSLAFQLFYMNNAQAETRKLKTNFVFDIAPTSLEESVHVNETGAKFKVEDVIDEGEKVTLVLKVVDKFKGKYNAGDTFKPVVWKGFFNRYPLIKGKTYILAFNHESEAGYCSYALIHYAVEEGTEGKSKVNYAVRMNPHDMRSGSIYKGRKVSTTLKSKIDNLGKLEDKDHKLPADNLMEVLKEIADSE